MNKYKAIGIMSGTSLDGIDLACCAFEKRGDKWVYTIETAETIKYTSDWKNRLENLPHSSAFEFAKTHIEFGTLLGNSAKKFIDDNGIKADLIASHGHTIFHQPQKGITIQIGSGAEIAAKCGLPVICDLRTLDVAYGGQGAPLVPIGDELLFSEYKYCLNLGGIANISYNDKGQRIAFDICPVNMVANMLAKEAGKDFDNGGEIGSKGNINEELLLQLNALDFYKINSNKPKSLGREWVENNIFSLFNNSTLPLSDRLATLYEHIALQINNSIGAKSSGKILITGGGAYNSFLIERIKAHSDLEIIIPDNKTIEFKEALIFAFLGVLRWRNEVNCLSSVTGAVKDNIGGCVYNGN